VLAEAGSVSVAAAVIAIATASSSSSEPRSISVLEPAWSSANTLRESRNGGRSRETALGSFFERALEALPCARTRALRALSSAASVNVHAPMSPAFHATSTRSALPRASA